MTSATVATESLQRRYRAPPPGITPAPGCPELDGILAAVLGERSVEKNRVLASHAALCPSCAIAWKLTRDCADEFGMSPAVPRPVARAGFGRGALAAAAAAILVITALLTWSWKEISSPTSGACSLNQEDTDMDGTGDACDPD